MSCEKRKSALLNLALLPAALMICVLSGCAVEQPDHNVILITIDTLRADHLGCYGYEKLPTSPRMDAFADQATRYTRHYASSPWTLPTHASLFTGLNPFEHGAVTIPTKTADENNVLPLPTSRTTVAEVFQEAGARTGAVVANSIFLGETWQVNQGFDDYIFDDKAGPEVKAPEVNGHVYQWLDQQNAKEPFFLFINYMDVHKPYNTTPRPGFLDPPAVVDNGELIEKLYQQAMPGDEPVDEALRQQVIDQYDTGVANVDEQIGLLLDQLKDLGLYENTQIILTSDHGEYFGEHHLVEHSKDVYQEALWTPLIIKDPGQKEGRVAEELVSSIDVPFLIFEQFEGKFGDKNLERFPAVPGEHLVIAENRYTRQKDLFNEQWGQRFNRLRAVVYQGQGPYKYIHSSDSNHELYDLEQDPFEEHNLIDTALGKPEAEKLAKLFKKYVEERVRAILNAEDAPVLSAEEIKRMRGIYMK